MVALELELAAASGALQALIMKELILCSTIHQSHCTITDKVQQWELQNDSASVAIELRYYKVRGPPKAHAHESRI